MWRINGWRVWEEDGKWDWESGGGGEFCRKSSQGVIYGNRFNGRVKEMRERGRKKGDKSRNVIFRAQITKMIPSLSTAASTSNVVIPKCEMCVGGGVLGEGR